MIEVCLTEAELRICEWVGKQRFANATKNNRDGGHERPDDARDHILGAQAEFATSIALNLCWRPTIGQIHSKDVGGFIEVRGTDLRNGCLIIKPQHEDDAPYVLVFAAPPRFEVLGWQMAQWGRDNGRFRTDVADPAYFVTQSQLRDINELAHFSTITGASDETKKAWGAYRANPGDATLRAALDATECIQRDKQAWLGTSRQGALTQT